MSNLRYALLSVSDKTNLIDFASKLHQLGYHLLSTDGTANALRQANLPVTLVSDLTQFPEILAGRVKTLHPKIYAGILHRGATDSETLKKYAIHSIDVVVVNLYPFQETIESEKCTFSDAIEQIDIGGPCLLRAAAKNHQRVFVVTEPSDYNKVATAIQTIEAPSTNTLRKNLAIKAFSHTSTYDAAIANYFAMATKCKSASLANTTQLEKFEAQEDLFPATLNLSVSKIPLELRYGENPHQKAAVYQWRQQSAPLLNAIQHQGKPLSYNNILDGDAAYRIIQGKIQPFCVIVKHNNPCGAAIADNIQEAYQKAYQCDPVSAFGGIIALNRPVDVALAETILAQQFLEVLIAPGFTQAALNVLKQKPNVRTLELPTMIEPDATLAIRSFQGGLLVQTQDNTSNTYASWHSPTVRKPTIKEESDLHFAWEISQFVSSNAIVYAKHGQTIGIGAGQMSRVFSAEIGLLKAKHAQLSMDGSVMASDAFFPFPDSVENAAQHGITAIIQPGGSMRDHEVIACANEYDIAMIFTGTRHFRH